MRSMFIEGLPLQSHIIYDSEKVPVETTAASTTDCEYSGTIKNSLFIYLIILLLIQ